MRRTDPDVRRDQDDALPDGTDSPIVAALARAAENGKQVAVLVELQARFDEEKNIQWARSLERAGVHVAYGVERPEDPRQDRARRPPRGQRHAALRPRRHRATTTASTSTIYTDLGLFTARAEFGHDASELFNYLTGFSQPHALQAADRRRRSRSTRRSCR